MFGSLGAPELLFILLLALLIFGPKALPEVGRTLGRGLAELRKASNELKRTINAEVLAEELRESDPRRVMKEALDPFSAPAPAPVAGYRPAPASPDASAGTAAEPAPGEASLAEATPAAPADGETPVAAEKPVAEAKTPAPAGSVARGALDEADASLPAATPTAG